MGTGSVVGWPADARHIAMMQRIDYLERELMTAHSMLPQNQYGCACEVCARYAAARAVAYDEMKRAEVQLIGELK